MSRLLSNSGEMKLKISGFGKEGRLVQIRSAKCTVGSAAGCTLRLRGGGVGPLACWILRGPGGAIVRRLHGVATLNGGQFEEAALRNGDQLRIGGVELEVVECNQSHQQAAAIFFAPVPNEIVAELEARLSDARANLQRLEAESRQGFQSSIVAADRAAQLRDALEAAHEELGDASRDLTAAQQTIAAQSETIAAQQREIEAIRIEATSAGEAKSAALVEEARRETAAAVKQCAATGAELAQVRSEAAREQSQWEEQRRQYELRLEQRAAEIEALRNAPAGQAGAMTVAFDRDGKPLDERADLEAQVKTLQEQIAAKDGDIESLRHEAEAAQTAVNSRLGSLQSEYECKCNELKAALDRVAETEQQLVNLAEMEGRIQSVLAREEGLSEREGSLCAAELRCSEERGALAAQGEQLAAERRKLTEDREQAAEAQQQLEQQRRQLSEYESKQDALAERELQFECREAELSEQLAAASARAIEVDAHREQLARLQESLDQRGQGLQRLQAELDARAAELEAKAAELETLRDELNANVAAIGAQQQNSEPGNTNGSEAGMPSACEMPIEGAPDATPENVVDHGALSAGASEDARESAGVDVVLSRLVKAGLWRGNEEAASGDEPSNGDEESPVSQTMIFSEPVLEPAAPLAEHDELQVPQQTESQRPAPAHGDDEESIESYMDRLMKRVRGDSNPLENKSKPASKPASKVVEAPAPSPSAAPIATAPEQAPVMCEAADYSPRRTAPELSNMSAMRDLANTAARSAIDEHVRTHTGKQATGKLFGACLTVCCCLLLAYWAWYTWSLPATVGAGIGGGIGLYWTWAAIRRLFSLMRLNRPKETPPANTISTDEKSIPAGTTP